MRGHRLEPWARTFMVVLFLAGALAFRAGEDPPEPRSGSGARGTVEVVRVKIVDDRFRPATITIDRGTVVKWKNRGNNTHTTTSDGRGWDSGRLAPGDRFRKKFRRAGVFAYHCQIHPTMRGTITVV